MKIQVKVTPNWNKDELSRDGDKFIVKVKEPPREGRANLAVVRLLAKHFGIPQSQIRIISGFRSRNKIIEVL
jgi:uncharacterized protein (TIGR00251 family)